MRALVLLLTALIMSAGCVGKDKDESSGLASAVDKITGPSEAELRATPGSIRGVVLSPSVEPIVGARVTLLRENISFTTGESGIFTFTGLANGGYLVSAEAEGYQTRTVQATARNGTVYEMQLTLTPAPSKVPYEETRELAGLLACGAVIQGPDGPRTVPCSSADANHRDAFEVDLAPDSLGLVVEVTWDAEANPGAKKLSLLVETVGYGSSDETLGEATGEGYARVEVPRAALEKFYPEGGRFRAIIGLVAQDTPPAGAAVQTPFTVFTTAFYHAPAPADFTVKSS